MSDPAFRHGSDADHDAGSHAGSGGGVAVGKRARTSALPARKGEAAKFAAEKIEHGMRDENKLTNEVFWWLEPALRDEKLKAGTAEAAEWLEVRDDIVRPALSGHETHEVTGSELAKESHAVVPRNEPMGPTGDALIDELLAHVPAHGSPNKVEAAWLLRALGTKLFGASDATRGQLQQLANGETALRTSDGKSGDAAIKRGLANLEKQKIHARQLEGSHYEVDGGHLPILRTMVDLGAGRIREWVRGGMKNRRSLFYFGDMVRADVDYAEDKKHSAHTSGNAIDLGGMSFNSEADVVSVLSTLEPGKIKQVFPDGGAGPIVAHVHLALGDDGLYELGIPFSSAFFQLSDSIFSQQKLEEQRAGGKDAEVGKVIHAEGLVMWHPVWYRSTGVYKGGGTWDWSKREYKGLARPHIKSGALKALLGKLDSGKALDVSVKAAQEDGVDPKTVEH